MKLDAKDKELIRALQLEGRMTNNELSQKINLSPSPCLRRLKNLEKHNVITGYSAEVDAKAFGLPITAFARVKLDRHSQETVKNFESHIGLAEQVLECYVMTGASDYLLKVLVADLQAYELFVRKVLHPIECIASIDTSFAYGTVKKTNILPHSHL